MLREATCSTCGYTGVWPRGQAIDWIAATFALVFPASHRVEVWRDLLHPPCPRCRNRTRERRGTSIFRAD